ncbi:guanine deaminase [Sulfitobacter donghicola]|uniref:Guanine deaminase n=1 Tax=Sulfitobacter donghicola DSW-25 = KCTC 12864 = JCM 14565 TaxID=1300350 RepID=A0A073IHR9_9RHOB|nr:guanine deaminase [Sulfitobacter donghicola]KEJ89893.1 guanine deaminase [Sulfitobacter donghicola DSW-25 = KCTC 12864 = JCM 14565]KIN66982.1 Guanine deaminase [Sulfitobacter donghicola DSW-25 = KCTC 12864 = JCM 14565]
MNNQTLLTGQVLTFDGNPFETAWDDCVHINSSGAVLLEGAKIAAVGDAAVLKADHPQARQVSYGQDLICPGFVDAHAHYPQTAMIASWGKRLIDWLNTYTFPEEARFGDPEYATAIAQRYLDLTAANGTTTIASFATIHPHSADALFAAAHKRGQSVVTGKTCMDRNAPDDLRDTAQSAYDDSKALINRWHGKGRAKYAITPRFSPTSTPEQLNALGALWAENPSCLMQTHLSEQPDEIEWVQGLYPDARDYLDTYESHGLLGARGLYGHAIHLTPREIDRLAEVQGRVIHCPTSNAFIGSGALDLPALAQRQIPLGLATDTGGGSSFSMLRTMAAAYEAAQHHGHALHAAQLMWLATAGSANSLHMSDEIGSLKAGNYADITVLDLKSTEAISQRANRSGSVWEDVFATIMLGDDRAIRETWIAGASRQS